LSVPLGLLFSVTFPRGIIGFAYFHHEGNGEPYCGANPRQVVCVVCDGFAPPHVVGGDGGYEAGGEPEDEA
jgi:hypothetical protein